MSSLAFSKSALRALRRLPPEMVHEIRLSAAQHIASKQFSPPSDEAAIQRLNGRGWRLTLNAQGTVLVIAHVAPATP